MLEKPSSRQIVTSVESNYGWVVVAACTLMIAVTYGILYSYSVFFKPLADNFNWDRATASLIFSALLVIRGAISIGTGWLADKYGPKRLMVFCGFMIGLGLVLSSQVQTSGQFFFTFAVIEAIGLSGAFGIGAALISSWFTKHRGLAIGILSTGSGLGTLFIVPGTERLVNTSGWHNAFIICGLAAGIIIIISALFLRHAPQPTISENIKPGSEVKASDSAGPLPNKMSIWQLIRDSRMILLMAIFFFFFFSVQIVMVHLVNYATDTGINPLVAATFISVIGAVSIASRLSTGVGSDKIGIQNILILTSIFLIIAFIYLIFSKSLWQFYLFAIIFSLPYGGEIPQVPLLIGKIFGTKSMATLVGINMLVISIGGALGSWMAGRVFDATQSYLWAFIAGALAGAVSLILTIALKKRMKQAEANS
jgi:MFS family permease